VIPAFYQEFNMKRWEKFNSEKICELAYGRIQGLEGLVDHFQNSSVLNQEDNKVKPVIISRN
jgi:RNA recognition motif 2